MRIAIDVDEVLSNTMPKVCKFHNEKYGTNFKVDDFFSYDWEEVWGGTTNDTTKKWFDFFKINKNKFETIDGAKESVNELSKKNKLIVISARQIEFKEHTINWLEKEFPSFFEKIILTNDFAVSGKRISKREICDKENIDILIEDQLKHALDCASEKRKVILFNYPWNQNKKLSKNIYRVNNWKEAMKLIKNDFE